MASGEGKPILSVVIGGALAAAAFLIARSAHDASHARIEMNERAHLVARLNSVLDPALRDRDLTTVRTTVTDLEHLGSGDPVDAFVLRDAGRPVATVLTSIAPLGYNAPIDLVVGIGPDSRVTGVRAVRHRETQGLGAFVDRAKSSWIEQFRGRSLAEPPREQWLVKQDEGAFDSIAGATVTSRAVVAAVKNALLYFEQHRDEIYAAATNSTTTEHEPRP